MCEFVTWTGSGRVAGLEVDEARCEAGCCRTVEVAVDGVEDAHGFETGEEGWRRMGVGDFERWRGGRIYGIGIFSRDEACFG